jgi:DNA-binding beta-propeller fold protein YncE
MTARRITRIAAGLVSVAAFAGLAGLVALRAPGKRVVLGSVPVGNPSWGPSWGTANVDSRLGRAFILDDGILQQQMTLTTGGGYSWSGSNSSNKIHIIDTRTGRLIKAIDVPQSVRSLAVDTATARVFVFDQGQIQVLDARSGSPLGTIPFTGNPNGFNDSIGTSLVDERAGRVFATVNPQDSNAPLDQHVLVLDGRTGRTLRDLAFPHGAGSTSIGPNGSRSTYYGPSLSLTLDARAGHLYVFNTNGQMSVVDSASGRLLSTRRLPVALAGARVDERTGRVFAVTAPPGAVAVGSSWHRQPPQSALVMLDPATGVIRTIAPATALFWGGPAATAIAGDSDRVFVLDGTRRAVDVRDGADGRLVRAVAVDGRPLQIALDGPHHRALVTAFSGYNDATVNERIAVLDTRTGALLRTISLGHVGYVLAVDTGTGHLVATYDTMAAAPADRYAWLPGWLRPRLPWIPPPPPSLGPNQRLLTHMALTIDPS